MKYALIGCGRIAVNHIKAVVNNGLELVAVCDLVPEHIDLLFEKTGYTGTPARYTDYREMLSEHPELELAAIATDSGFSTLRNFQRLFKDYTGMTPLEFKDTLEQETAAN